MNEEGGSFVMECDKQENKANKATTWGPYDNIPRKATNRADGFEPQYF
jgi:hypothetical protein